MSFFLKKLLAFLFISLVTVSAQSESEIDECNAKYDQCIQVCAEEDEPCMVACDKKYACPEEGVEEETVKVPEEL